MKKTNKVHRFSHCSNVPYFAQDTTHFTDDIRLVTCGQCKRRILNMIADEDWSKYKSNKLLALLDEKSLETWQRQTIKKKQTRES